MGLFSSSVPRSPFISLLHKRGFLQWNEQSLPRRRVRSREWTTEQQKHGPHADVAKTVSASQGEHRGKSAGAETKRAPVAWRRWLKSGKPAHIVEKAASPGKRNGLPKCTSTGKQGSKQWGSTAKSRPHNIVTRRASATFLVNKVFSQFKKLTNLWKCMDLYLNEQSGSNPKLQIWSIVSHREGTCWLRQ